MLNENDLVAIKEMDLDDSVENAELSNGDLGIIRRARVSAGGGVLFASCPGIIMKKRWELETDCGEDLGLVYVSRA